MPDATPGDPSASLVGLHRRRVRRVLLLGCGIMVATSLFWGTMFALRGDGMAVLLDLITLGLAIGTWQLVRLGQLRAASRLLMATMFVLLLVNAALLDIPSPDVPRSAHQFLLALAVVSCLLTRDEPPWLRHGVPLVCLVTYAVFSSSTLGWVTPLALPESIRASGVWINHGIALFMVYAALHVMQTDAAERNGLEAQLREALLQGQMLLHYQPQVADDQRVIGAEALVRWQHPQRGMVSPGEFIPVAERSGLMLPLGDWVLRTACFQLAAWSRRPETAALTLAVNVSASQFKQRDFTAQVLMHVRQSGADPTRLKLELTESMLAHDLADIIAKMNALKSHGIGFSLDDFGTGFSSLSYLRSLPLDQLKIDQSFVRDMMSSGNDTAIVQAVVTLGQSLGLEVIAEGVETAEQRDFLAGLGCSVYQGYLFSKPVPVAAFDALLAATEPARMASVRMPMSPLPTS